MTSGRLRPGTYGDEYIVSGSLAGISGPGSRRVCRLQLQRLDEGSGGLEALHAFPDLEVLELSKVNGVDLSPIGDLGIEDLGMDQVSGADLGFLARMTRLRDFAVSDSRDCSVPERLVLPSALRWLSMTSDGSRASNAMVEALAAAIDWSRLEHLESLQISSDGPYEAGPLRIDLGLLTHLPALTRLEMPHGVQHSGAVGSPLEPPFGGLSRSLEWVRIDSADPDRETLRRKMQAYLGSALPKGMPVIYKRYETKRGAGRWEIFGPEEPGDGWSTYGSLFEVIDDEEIETESEAAEVARRRLREADAELARRIKFDGESAGTDIAATTRDELEAALRIIGIRQ